MGTSPESPCRRRLASAGVAAAVLLGLAACGVSPAPHTQASAVLLETPDGPASVGMNESLPNMTAAESQALMMAAMQKALPAGVAADPSAGPRLRFVWHVIPIFPSGATSRLTLNVFDGPAPFWSEQTVIGSDESRQALMGTMESMTSRLAAEALGPTSAHAGGQLA